MAILLLGSVEEHFNVSEREFMTIVDFAFAELKIPERVSLFFEFEEVEGYLGFAHNYECDEDEYYIVLCPSIPSWTELVKTIFHEMEHVRQDVYRDRFGDTWKGVPYNPEELSYEQLPWEMEAFRMEELLYNKYLMD